MGKKTKDQKKAANIQSAKMDIQNLVEEYRETTMSQALKEEIALEKARTTVKAKKSNSSNRVYYCINDRTQLALKGTKLKISGELKISSELEEIGFFEVYFCPSCKLQYVDYSSAPWIKMFNLGERAFINLSYVDYRDKLHKETINAIVNGRYDNNASRPKKSRKDLKGSKTKKIKNPAQILRESGRKKLDETQSSLVAIYIKFDNYKQDDDTFNAWYVIVKNQKEEDQSQHIFYYASEAGRELLSAAYAEQKNKRGELNAYTYSVVQCVYQEDYEYLPEELVPTILNVRRKRKGADNKQLEMVNALLYSPFTKRFELILVGYDKEQLECYITIQRYRSFVKRYGNPGVSPTIEIGRKSGWDLDNLNTESILTEYGYTVAQNVGLSSKERHELLAEVIDLEILDSIDIINHLEFCISLHPNEKYVYARSKWKEDIGFVENYNFNPDRFLIAEKAGRTH